MSLSGNLTARRNIVLYILIPTEYRLSDKLIAKRKTADSNFEAKCYIVTRCNASIRSFIQIKKKMSSFSYNFVRFYNFTVLLTEFFFLWLVLSCLLCEKHSWFSFRLQWIYFYSFVLKYESRYVDITTNHVLYSSQRRWTNRWMVFHPLSSRGEYKSSFPLGYYTREMLYIMKISIARDRENFHEDRWRWLRRMFDTQCSVWKINVQKYGLIMHQLVPLI